MAGLEIKYEVVKECISDIEQLSANYPAAAREAVCGEGQGIAEMERMAGLYEEFYEALVMLSEETAAYLNHVITDFREMDEKKA